MVVPGPPFQSPGLLGTASFTSPVLMIATQLGPDGSRLPSITGRLVFKHSSNLLAIATSTFAGLDAASALASRVVAACVGNSRCNTAPTTANASAHATAINIVRLSVRN